MVLLFLGIHIVICVIIGYKLHKKQIKTRTFLFPAVVFVPVFGVLLLCVELWMDKYQKAGSKALELDKLRVQDAKFRRIEVEREDNTEIVVPLEEAIAINDAKTRRKLMLDILHRNPEEHVELLQRARLTDDTELTHYATTTMMEIQSSYEQTIRELEQDVELKRATEDKEEIKRALRKLRKELEQYIDSGLITGNILTIYRRKLEGVLEQLMLLEPENKNYYLGKIENALEQGKLDGIEEALRTAQNRWPEDEDVYHLFVRYYQMLHRGDLIQQILDEIERKEVYLSREGKKWFAFWRNKELDT